MGSNDQVKVRIAGSGSFLPGSPIPIEEIENYLGKVTKPRKK